VLVFKPDQKGKAEQALKNASDATATMIAGPLLVVLGVFIAGLCTYGSDNPAPLIITLILGIVTVSVLYIYVYQPAHREVAHLRSINHILDIEDPQLVEFVNQANSIRDEWLNRYDERMYAMLLKLSKCDGGEREYAVPQDIVDNLTELRGRLDNGWRYEGDM
jgi:hypothetical protein